MSPTAFIKLLAQAMVDVEDAQDLDNVFNAQAFIDGLADTRMDPEVKEWAIELCSEYAKAQVNLIFKSEFNSLMEFNEVTDNETES